MKFIYSLLFVGALASSAIAKQPVGQVKTRKAVNYRTAALPCNPATSSTDLDINNVRAKLLGGGDFWWDLSNAKYEIPKVDPSSGAISRHSIYSGGLWFGGLAGGNQLRTAGQTYRTGGDEFWPGPLDTTNATITKEECAVWDRHFKVDQADIKDYLAGKLTSGPGFKAIKEWPASPLPGSLTPGTISRSLAPYVDANKNGTYDGMDYPDFKGDQAVWWVFNDAGAPHGHFPNGSLVIGLEIQALAFAFKTNDELNNMTFYKYKIINRSNTVLDSTYMGVFADTDLGDANDDYIGCDAGLGVGYVYNGDDFDGGNVGYGSNPPALGIDFFEGPSNEFGTKLPMTNFMYFTNNAPTQQADPSTAAGAYNYLRSIWNDGTPLTYGGTGYNTKSSDKAKFAFAGKTDPQGRAEWTEALEGTKPGDRRLLQAAGPFKLVAGAVNNITIGVVWARASSGGAQRSLLEMLDADSKAQGLFNSGFAIAEGPRTPDVEVVELDQRIILSLYNTKQTETYSQIEPTPSGPFLYKFEGYQIFQLKDNTVTVGDIRDPNKARPIFQCDLKNSVRTIVNKSYSVFFGETVPQALVEGQDKGISHSFEVTNDAFTGAKLSNSKRYYFICLAYGYASNAKRDTGNKANQFSFQYLAGRNNIPDGGYVAIPQKPGPRLDGTKLNADAGTGPKIKRLSGAGNGGVALDLVDEPTQLQELISTGIIKNPVYTNGHGPVQVKVLNPFKLKDKRFRLYFKDASYNKGGMDTWMLQDIDNPTEIVQSDNPISIFSEQVLPQYGISIAVDRRQKAPGLDQNNNNNGFIESSIVYPNLNGGVEWFMPMKNNPASTSKQNWIIAFSAKGESGKADSLLDQDNNDIYRTILNGRICPYKFTSPVPGTGPAINSAAAQNNFKNPLSNLVSVDLVLTPDQSKWSECIVTESGNTSSSNPTIGGALKGNLRMSTDGTRAMGRGVFPGYAVNLETGERLNVFFSEASNTTKAIGKDMKFNPNNDTTAGYNGGKHYIYISPTRYDSCNGLYKSLTTPSMTSNPNTSPDKVNAYAKINWVLVGLADSAHFLQSDVKVRVRVSKPIIPFVVASDMINDGFPAYEFSTADLAPQTGNKEAAKSALDLVNIVPNPYYGDSQYEFSKTDTRVRITNLPRRAIISIYSLAGDLIKRIDKDSESATFVDWDLKNDNNVPIASGMYIIHVRVPNVGEKVIKWFGVMHPLDLDNF